MATLEELQTTIDGVLDDDEGFSLDRIAALINQGVRFCSKVVLLPALETSGVVSTVVGVDHVDIPASWSFGRNLYHCSSADEEEVRVLNSFAAMLQEYPGLRTDQTGGSVKRICIRGNTLVYYPIPETITELTCSFYEMPTLLVNDTDTPDCLPVEMHEELLENYVLWKCWAEIEDGIEGAKINTKYYRELFDIAIGNLDMLIDHGQSRCRPTLDNGWI